MPRRLTTEQFIGKAIRLHGNRYSYGLTNYVNSRTKVTITCPVHGPFQQKATIHLQGNGCDWCSGTVLLGQQEFLRRARECHGDRYDYSQFVYRGYRARGIIICPVHGAFEQLAQSHCRGRGCLLCGHEKNVLTQEAFLANARKVHGDRYDYSRFVYRGARIPGTIICAIHGPFEQWPTTHTKGSGCVECGRAQASEHPNRKRPRPRPVIGTEEFIRRAREVHGDRFDYNEVDYKRSTIPVTIICRLHGRFQQIPHVHLNAKHACPNCVGLSIGEQARERPKRYKITYEEFLRRASRFGQRFDYSQVVYYCFQNPVKIICRKHGPFTVTPENHVRFPGNGWCRGCKIEATVANAHARSNKLPVTITHPHLLTEWHPSNAIRPEDVTYTSTQRIRWICASGHVWVTSLRTRTNGKGHGCKRCAHRRATPTNNVAITHSHLLAQWHPDNSITLAQVTAGSGDRLKWICPTNSAHIWEATVCTRTGGYHGKGVGCPICASADRRTRMIQIHYPDWQADIAREESRQSLNQSLGEPVVPTRLT